MSSSTKLWEAWVLAKTLHQRPSEIYFVVDELAAWCFDRAVTTFGLAVEGAIEKATAKAKTMEEAKRKGKRELDKWLREPDEGPKFRDPAAERKALTRG